MTTRSMAPWSQLALLAICSSFGIGACGGDDSSEREDVGTTTQSLTTVIQTSRTCTHDVVSSGCFDVPPKQIHGCDSILGCNPIVCLPGNPCNPLPAGIDGVLSPHEYDRATEFPYTDQVLKAEAKVRVKAFQYDSGINKGQGYMNVYLEGMPFTPITNMSTFGGGVRRGSLYVVYVDFNRFTGADTLVGPEDRFFAIDLTGTSPAGIFREDSPGVFTNLGNAQYHPGACMPDPSTSAIWRCNGELRIQLGDAMKRFASPDDDVDPGIGFEVFPLETGPSMAGLPEIAAAYFPLNTLITNRSIAVSLLFARPKGYRLQYMSWNIRRSKSPSVKIDHARL